MIAGDWTKMASRRPRRDMPSVYGRDHPLLRGEGSSSGVASAGGDERRTRGSSCRRQRSPPSPRDEVLEEEHVTVKGPNMARGGVNSLFKNYKSTRAI